MYSFPTPSEAVNVEHMGEHFTKYHLGDGRVLHRFTKAEDEDYHDHPWPFHSSVLSGGYVEEVAEPLADGTLLITTVERVAGTSHEVQASTIHKLTGLMGSECWTLVTPGRKQREPGFYRVDKSGIWHRFWHQSEWTLFVKRD